MSESESKKGPAKDRMAQKYRIQGGDRGEQLLRSLCVWTVWRADGQRRRASAYDST